jgi:hypothetical protein
MHFRLANNIRSVGGAAVARVTRGAGREAGGEEFRRSFLAGFLLWFYDYLRLLK